MFYLSWISHTEGEVDGTLVSTVVGEDDGVPLGLDVSDSEGVFYVTQRGLDRRKMGWCTTCPEYHIPKAKLKAHLSVLFWRRMTACHSD